MLEYVKNVVVMTRTRRGRCEELSYLISPICKLHLERARKTTWSPGFQVLLPKDSKDSDFLSAATTGDRVLSTIVYREGASPATKIPGSSTTDPDKD